MIRNRPAPETRVADLPAPLVEVSEIRFTDVAMSVFTEGTVMPRTQSELVPEVAGRVIEVSPSLVSGGFFEKDDVLLRLDPRDYELAIVRTRAAIAQAELRLATERQEAALAQNEWELLGNGRPTPLAMREPQIAEALAALASAQATLEQAGYNLERTVLRAPYAGRVRQERVDVGQYVVPGASVATLYAIDVAEVRLPIADKELAYVNLPLAYRQDGNEADPRGPRVTLRSNFGGKNHEWTGDIVRTEGVIDPETRMIHVIARVNDRYARGADPSRPPLAVGMFVEAEIRGRRSGPVVVLPRSVIRGTNDVLVVQDGVLFFRKVGFLRQERDRVLVNAGLEDGDRVVTSPLEGAVSGMRVRVQEAEPVEPEE